MTSVTWILESSIFPVTHPALRAAIRRFGHTLVDWNDSWWNEGIPQSIPRGPVIFHGSLGNAALIEERLNWVPGSLCPVDAFRCSTWYESAKEFLIHRDWQILPARDFVANAVEIARALGSPDTVFVRPDSPLKPFSGRVIDVAAVTLSKLDHGFYYDDERLPVVVAPVRQINQEWRFVIVQNQIVAGSMYDASMRKAVSVDRGSSASAFAAQIALAIPPPAEVFILDVCECDGDYWLLELNPFGGADFYSCVPEGIVEALSAFAISNTNAG